MIFVKIFVKILTFIGTLIIKKQRNWKRNKGKRNKTHKQTSDQTNKQTNKETKKQSKQRRLFFWSDAMAGAIACGQTKQIKNNEQAITWTNTKSWTVHVETGLAPHISKSHPRTCGSDCLVWPTSARVCVFLIEIVKRQNDRRFGNFKNMWR